MTNKNTMLNNLTKAQFEEYLVKKYNLQTAQEVNLLKVKDGTITEDDYVYWHNENGPELILASNHRSNIKKFPQFYSIKKPVTKVTYTYE